jgi:acyl-CoA synthetase (NDP forming)
MLTEEMREILAESRDAGWVLEPKAKRFLSLAGLEVPRFSWVKTRDEAVRSARQMGYPVVGKVVSPRVLHKSDRDGVMVGVDGDEEVAAVYDRFCQIEGFSGMLVEPMVSGVELIVGAKIDYQFGPVILVGVGGTGVEIYRDVVLRMAPLTAKDVRSMVQGLKAHRILEGYRGADPVDVEKLAGLVVDFSSLVMDLQEIIESIDLNPVMCASSSCVVADARMILKKEG